MAHKKKVKLAFIPGVILIVFFTALIFVWEQIQVIKVGYTISKLKSQIEQQENENKHLKIKLNNLCSLERVEKIAYQKLKMISPSPENIIYLNESVEK